jgi:formylmethanofuran dehydrogenase subunit D
MYIDKNSSQLKKVDASLIHGVSSLKTKHGGLPMTICVSVKVGEGLVLAADSAVTLEAMLTTPQGVQVNQIVQNFNYANKVAHFKDYPVGVLNWGLATINARSLHSLIMEFEYTHPPLEANPGYDVNTIATQLFDFLKVKYDAAFPVVPAAGIPVAAPSPASIPPPVANRPV